MTPPLRGQIFWCDLGHGKKPWVVVSNNSRNRNLSTVLAARVTTTPKSGIPTAVQLSPDDPLTGWILADDLQQLFHDELETGGGAVSPPTVLRLNVALALALGLP